MKRVIPFIFLAVAVFSLAIAIHNLKFEIKFFYDTPDISVIDGDTVRINTQRFRLLGYDTPEMRGRCAQETALAHKATARLEELIIKATDVALKPIGVYDRYGRSLANLKIDGKNVSKTLISEKLARPYHGGRRKGWCN